MKKKLVWFFAIGVFVAALAISIFYFWPKDKPILGQIKIETIEEGEGEPAKKWSSILINYELWYYKDGKKVKFDSTYEREKPYLYRRSEGKIFKGWDKAFDHIKENERRRIFFPSHLAYGKKGAGQLVPPDADLEMVVEILKIAD